MTSTSSPCAASSAAFTASLFSVAVSPMQTTRSPRCRPAALAGLAVLPSARSTSEKPTMSAPSENILTPKGRPADGYAGACCHHRADGLDGQPAAQGQRGLVAAHRAGADNILVPVQAQRLHPAKPGQHKGRSGSRYTRSGRQAFSQPSAAASAASRYTAASFTRRPLPLLRFCSSTRFAPFRGLGVVCAKEMRIINKKSPSAKADELICLYAEEGT